MEGTEFVLAILFLFVLPIVIIGTFTSHRKEMAKMKLKLGNAEAEKVTLELESVKSRLEVLEAIVTDKKYQLNSEFDALRNQDSLTRQ